jgi:hypothetical protein
MYPTYLWEKGERVADNYEFTIKSDAPAGTYGFAIGMCELQTLERLPINTRSVEMTPDDRLILSGPTVSKPEL